MAEGELKSVSISSFDDEQTIPIITDEFEKIDGGGSFELNHAIRSYYHNEAERCWPHLFGPGQLSRNEETVHVQLTRALARALDCSALTTAELFNTPDCYICGKDHPANHFIFTRPVLPSFRTGRTTSPQTDFYWLMDRQTYKIMLVCNDRSFAIMRAYKRRMKKRDKFIESKKYLKIATGSNNGTFIEQWNEIWQGVNYLTKNIVDSLGCVCMPGVGCVWGNRVNQRDEF